MLGEPVSYERIPYFFSDQNRIGLEHSGYATEWEEVVFRGERGRGAFVAFWLSDGRLVADVNVNIWDVNEHVQALIRSRSPRRPRRADGSGHPLDSLVGSISTGLLSFAPQGA